MNDIQSIRDNRAVDELEEAIGSAIDAGWNVQRFRRAAAEAWERVLRQQIANAKEAWRE